MNPDNLNERFVDLNEEECMKIPRKTKKKMNLWSGENGHYHTKMKTVMWSTEFSFCYEYNFR